MSLTIGALIGHALGNASASSGGVPPTPANSYTDWSGVEYTDWSGVVYTDWS